ncbi:MAG: ornithine carbamoyltransferase [Candidatus Limnocylindrales bacterium]|jgi:ornithine carbamoyltransferase
MTRHLLTLDSLGREGLLVNLELARQLKAVKGMAREALAGGRVGLIFDKPSTRTRVSFEAAAWGLGMLPIALRPDELQLGRGETIADTARVLSRYLTAIAIRTFEQARVEELARYATIPIINALTDDHHPCQALADVMTLQEEFGELVGLRVAFIGDGNNVCHSLIQAAGYLGFTLAVSTPEGYEPKADVVEAARAHGRSNGGAIELGHDPRAAVRGADAVYTDVWASMGQEKEREERARVFAGYCVDRELMALAAPRAIFLHCLPAHRGDEVIDEVMDGPQSRVWDEAENRWYTEQALLYALITGEQRWKHLG